MIPKNRTPSHPGTILREEYLVESNISEEAFARHLHIDVGRICAIVQGEASITSEIAWLFADALGTSPEFWLNLQTAYNLAKHRPAFHPEKIVL